MAPETLPPAIVLPGVRDQLVAADVIGMPVRVDDVADRLVAEICANRARAATSAAVASFVSTTSTPSVADLHGGVAAGADDHVDAVAHGPDRELGGASRRLLRAPLRYGCDAAPSSRDDSRARAHEALRTARVPAAACPARGGSGSS